MFRKSKLMKRCVLIVFVFFNAIVLTVQLKGQTTVPFFLTIVPDARAGSMGQSGVAGNCDANSIFWNAAKLSFAEHKTGISFSYKPWLRSLIPDANLSTVSAYYKPDSTSSFGGSLSYFSQGSLITTSPAGILTQYKPNEFAVDFAYARKLSRVFSASLTGRFGHSDVGNGSGNYSRVSYWSADAGFFYRSNLFHFVNHISQFSAGITTVNIGPKTRYVSYYYKQNQPANVRLGASLSTWFVPFHKLTIQTEMNNYVSDINFPEQWNLCSGVEYEYNKIVALRAGYVYNRLPFINYVTIGGGIRYSVFDLDLAYILPTSAYHGPYERGIQFTLMVDFGKVNASKKIKS
jgi:hypothetical protein